MTRSDKQKEDRLWEENLNYQGCLAKIVGYNKSNDIVVEFQDKYKSRIHTSYRHFLSGQIKNPYHPTVFGVGILGNKYPSQINGKLTKEYNMWSGMLRRCYDEKYKDKKPTYRYVKCCDEWLLYENFYEWLHSQSNFPKWLNDDKWSIDKDILIKGNKTYSPKACCLVPASINSLFVKCNANRGNLPIAVQKHQQKYRACFTAFNKYITLPVRNTINEAFLDYKQYKENIIKEIAQEEYNKGNITKQCYEAMMNYEVEIND